MLGYLIALGHDWEYIANHEDIGSKPEAVRRQAQRLGLVLRERPIDLVPAGIIHVFDEAAKRYEMTGPGLFRRFVKEAASDPSIIHNVVDIEL